MASLRNLHHVRLIDRDFLLDHKETFGATLQEIIYEDALNYESSMIVLLMDELIGVQLSNVGARFP